jgi:hypothetical protein
LVSTDVLDAVAVWLLTFFRQLPRIWKRRDADGATRLRRCATAASPPRRIETAILTFLLLERVPRALIHARPDRYTCQSPSLFRGRYQVPWAKCWRNCAGHDSRLLVLACQRRIVAGLTVGATKG